jgi:tryptophan synthase alpha chain
MLEKYLNNRKEKKSLLIMAHLVIGYPSIEDNYLMLDEMEKNNVDIVECQFPFSEPLADGPLFVQANQKALDNGITINDCFEFVSKASKKYSFPILMMGYYNTIYARGEQKFCEDLSKSGGKGFIVPDLPLSESENLFEHAKQNDLEPILIITPNTDLERKRKICESSGGFVYCVARKGVTGLKTEFDNSFESYIKEIKSVCDKPIALGFGVKSKDDFDALRGCVDIAVLGTAALKAYEEGGVEAFGDLLKCHLE